MGVPHRTVPENRVFSGEFARRRSCKLDRSTAADTFVTPVTSFDGTALIAGDIL